MFERWDKLKSHELFQLIDHWFETETGSNDLFTPGEAYITQLKPNWQKKKSPNQNQNQNQKQNQGRQSRADRDMSARNRSKSASVPRNMGSGNTNQKCGWWGRQHPRDKCPAKSQKCNKCGKMGHYQSVCRAPSTVNTAESTANVVMANTGTKPKASVNQVQIPDDVVRIVGWGLELNSIVVDMKQDSCATAVDLGVEKLDMVLCVLTDSSGNSCQMDSLPDTGANINVMPDNNARSFATYKKCQVLGDYKPKTAGGTLQIIGVVKTNVLVNDIFLKDVFWCTANVEKAPSVARAVTS